ncbi:MAG: RagB/SusD family nutrient uptake outer membrane protein [Phocaeicola sp.]|nr:RagB/SusD family nutrient uptake outer membrane protein [Phocaeicola sp.]
MKRYIKKTISIASLVLLFGTTSCVNDLDVNPIDPNYVEATPEALFTKCYATIAAAGNGGADGDSDVDGIDGGTSGYYRQMWNAQVLTSDEAICGWGDEGISDFVYNTYDASHPMLRGYYYRLYTAITFCNEYLQDYEDYDPTMTAEIRFLRAFHYFNLMDGYGDVPFVTTISSEKPQQISRAELFDFVESELLELEPNLSEAKAKKSSDANYGRVDKAAAWLLLARLYLNAEVYTGTAQWAKAAEYAKKVMDSDYKLLTTGQDVWTAYQMLFMGDNGETDAAYEIIFPLLQDGQRTTSWGTSLYLIAGTFKNDMKEDPRQDGLDLTGWDTKEKALTMKPDGEVNEYDEQARSTNGTTEGWEGSRARADLVKKFFPDGDAPIGLHGYEMYQVAGDDRALFNSIGRTLENEEFGVFTSGFGVTKFTNYKVDGSAGSDPQHPDMDTPVMRKAEAYLIYAEATAHTNNGVATSEGVNALKELRLRAHAEVKTSYTLDEILDEWSRELYFEGHRRMALIRNNKFGGNVGYNWAWKGGVLEGRDIPAERNLFAIPTTDLVANSNLVQNPGY